MILDTSEFPLVWMHDASAPEPHDEDAAFTVLEELLRRGEPFVVLSEAGDRSPDHEQTQEEKKRTSLWMKKHRRELKLVKAMVAVEPSTAKRLAMKPFSIMFEKFWGYPMLMASTRDEALALAQKLLRNHAPE
jgi:LmbE family N-acetylglucosaminyl deacetylase